MEWVLSGMLFQSLQEFTCKLYCSQPETDNINELRYRLFCARKGNIDSNQFAPCVDCLFMPASRANFQAAIWKRSLQGYQGTPTPIGSGWREDCDHFAIDWTSGDPAPTAVLELLSYSCTRSCHLPTCSCLANSLKCTDVTTDLKILPRSLFQITATRTRKSNFNYQCNTCTSSFLYPEELFKLNISCWHKLWKRLRFSITKNQCM